jgi:O-antigen/teichoic acid export membrane protein
LISKYLPKGSFARNVLTLMTGTTLAQAIPIAVSPILTRLFSPAEFGVFAVYLAIVSVLAILATGRYELAIMVPKKDRDAAALAVAAFMLSLFVSLVILNAWAHIGRGTWPGNRFSPTGLERQE